MRLDLPHATPQLPPEHLSAHRPCDVPPSTPPNFPAYFRNPTNPPFQSLSDRPLMSLCFCHLPRCYRGRLTSYIVPLSDRLGHPNESFLAPLPGTFRSTPEGPGPKDLFAPFFKPESFSPPPVCRPPPHAASGHPTVVFSTSKASACPTELQAPFPYNEVAFSRFLFLRTFPPM